MGKPRLLNDCLTPEEKRAFLLGHSQLRLNEHFHHQSLPAARGLLSLLGVRALCLSLGLRVACGH